MIVVKYEEEQDDLATGTVKYVPLGTESHQDIEEVLLPDPPTANDPIFFTKKFVGRPEYRWEVKTVGQDLTVAQRTYIVTLRRRSQLDKRFYLKNILAARASSAVHVLRPWVIVEVELGHALTVGKANGDVRSSKRYVDTMQRLSMPKKRLAIVNQVHLGRDELIQIIPISSRPPRRGDNTMVEVTSCLTSMVQYQKPSWAVCRMMQTVTASRIIAPLIQTSPTTSARDRGFHTQVRGAVRTALKDAIMYGVAADGRVTAAQSLSQALAQIQALNVQTATLTQQVAHLESQVELYEQWAGDEGVTIDDLRDLYPN